MNFPAELKYSKSHEWIKMEGDTAIIGISDFAQDALGDLVFVNLPQVGDTFTAGEAFGDVESVKAVSDLLSPVTGVVCAINEELETRKAEEAKRNEIRDAVANGAGETIEEIKEERENKPMGIEEIRNSKEYVDFKKWLCYHV